MKQDLQKQDIVFVDTEVNPTKKIVEDIGAVRAVTPVASVNGTKFRSSNLYELEKFLKDATYVCGHNIINFDLKYIMPQVEQAGVRSIIDTLYLSALLFPQREWNLIRFICWSVDILN